MALLQLWSSDYSRKAKESPGDLKWQIAAFVDYYNPAERGDIIMLERKEIKREKPSGNAACFIEKRPPKMTTLMNQSLR